METLTDMLLKASIEQAIAQAKELAEYNIVACLSVALEILREHSDRIR